VKGSGKRHSKLLEALNHPLRRRILRTLHEAGEARSPGELGRDFRLPVSNVSYHVKVLREKDAVALTDLRPARGSVEHFYVSLVAANEMAIQLLDSTEEEDASLP
jgi:DNA-binding transcriptional ArsR family regulator